MHDEDLDLGHIIGAGLTLTATALLPRQSTPLLLETAPEYSPALRLKRLGRSGTMGTQQPLTTDYHAVCACWGHRDASERGKTCIATFGCFSGPEDGPV